MKLIFQYGFVIFLNISCYKCMFFYKLSLKIVQIFLLKNFLFNIFVVICHLSLFQNFESFRYVDFVKNLLIRDYCVQQLSRPTFCQQSKRHINID